MAMNNMLTLSMYLDAQPGGVLPELHLKEDCTSVHVYLLIKNSSLHTNAGSKDCIIKGKRPDGTEIYIRLFTTLSDGLLSVHLYNGDVNKLAKAAGSYECTLSLCDTTAHPTRATYMNYNFQTVLPFTVVVHEKAGRDDTDA